MSTREITLCGPKGAGRFALVDAADYELVSAYRWNLFETDRGDGRRPSGPYAHTSVRGKQLFMHKLITGYARTDHINHDGLDNRRSNLREATVAQNCYNRRLRSDARSAYKGITWVPRNNRWIARITVDGKVRHLGTFRSEIAAALAYDDAAMKLHGKYAYMNFHVADT